jgi:hypothetical protein
MTQHSKICIVRTLPEDMMRPQTTIRHDDRIPAISPRQKLWKSGSTLRVRFIGGTPAQQARTKEQAFWWTPFANLRFDFDNAPDAEIRIAFNADECAWSYIGTDAKRLPIDQPTMNLGCAEGSIAAHVFGHAIGLEHVRQNPAGGMQFDEAAMIRDLSGPPMYWTTEQVRQFLTEKYLPNTSGTWFDPDSIMLDFFPQEWTLDGLGIMANTALSVRDKALIAKLYPRL